MAANDIRMLAAMARAGMGAVLPGQGLEALSRVLTTLQGLTGTAILPVTPHNGFIS